MSRTSTPDNPEQEVHVPKVIKNVNTLKTIKEKIRLTSKCKSTYTSNIYKRTIKDEKNVTFIFFKNKKNKTLHITMSPLSISETIIPNFSTISEFWMEVIIQQINKVQV